MKEGENIANYLLSHYKGQYRILCEYDIRLNSFPRKLDGTYEDIDCFIVCANKVRIYSYGRGILEAYIPSIGRGRNILRAIKEEIGNNIVSNIIETDEEVLFHFNAKYIKDLEKYLKPRTSGASISPFSNKNLPKNKSYKIPDADLLPYKKLIVNLPQNQLILVGKYTTKFIQSLTTKKNSWENIKADMALKGLKGKEYIYSIGKWNEYIKYLERNLNENN